MLQMNGVQFKRAVKPKACVVAHEVGLACLANHGQAAVGSEFERDRPWR